MKKHVKNAHGTFPSMVLYTDEVSILRQKMHKLSNLCSASLYEQSKQEVVTALFVALGFA
jgi:hypothetical protein